MEKTQSGNRVFFGEDWCIVDGDEKTATHLVGCSFPGGIQFGGTGVPFDVRYEEALTASVRGENKAKSRIRTGDGESFR